MHADMFHEADPVGANRNAFPAAFRTESRDIKDIPPPFMSLAGSSCRACGLDLEV